MAEKYSSKSLREVKGKRGSRWKGVLKYKVVNPNYVDPPKGEDTRTANQKQRVEWKQVAKTFPKEVCDRDEAEVLLDEWREEMEKAFQMSEQAKMNVINYINSYIDLRERIPINGKKKLEASTALDYRKSCRRLEDGFSDMSMGEVTTKYVRNWERSQLEAGVSAYQVRKCHRLLHLVFENAYMEEEIAENPVARVAPPSAERKKDPNSLDQAGMRFVTAQLEASEPTPVVTAAYIALHAGLRCGECCALKWSDIHFEEETLTVRGSIGIAKGGSYEKGTKNGRTRVVDFDSEHMAELLKNRRDFMLKERGNKSTDLDSLYVCGNAAGDYARPTTISREWSTMAKNWGLKGTTGELINFHALRHSYITAQLSSGSNPRDVADNAGHASTQMTLDIYASALRKGKKRAAKLCGEYMRTHKPADPV